jgi:4-amino-4-deoxy-L-arabinose transferase-like glycosyltransferase
VKNPFSETLKCINKRYVVLALIILTASLSSILFFYHLNTEPFQDYDEATYAEITHESLSYHEFGTFTFLNNLYFNKPPVLFWLMDASESVLHNQETGARFPSAFSGFLSLVAVGLVVFFVTMDWYAAILGAGILATTSAFIEPARQARFDILVSLFIVLTTYAFLRALQGGTKDRKWFIWFGLFAGLTVLTKGPLIIYAGAAIVGILLVYRKCNWIKDPYFWGGVLLSAAIILPWHIYETVLYGSTFWDTYLFGQLVDRVQENLFTVGPTNGQYIQYIFQFASPWAYVFCASLAVTPRFWKKLSLQTKAILIGSLFGILSVIVVCFVTKTKAFSYLIPLYPFMAIYCAIIFYQFSKTKFFYTKAAVVLVCIILLINGYILSIYNGFHINTYFAAEVSLATQEKAIGEILKQKEASTFYLYDTTTLGSIMYYSRLLSPIDLNSREGMPSNSYILYQTGELSKLSILLPNQKIVPVYSGTKLTLAQVQ